MLVKKISEMKLSPNDGKEINISKIKLVNSNGQKKEKEPIKFTEIKKINIIPSKNNIVNNNNDRDQIERHKLMIKLYNIQKEVEVEEFECEPEEIKLKNVDVNSMTRDFNFVFVNFYFILFLFFVYFFRIVMKNWSVVMKVNLKILMILK